MKTKSTSEACEADRLPDVLEHALQEDDEPETVFVSPVSKGCALWRGIRFRIQSQETEEMATIQDDLSEAAEFRSLFRELGLNVEPKELCEWLSTDCNDTGCEVLTDAEICDLVSAPDIDSEVDHDQEEQPCPISHSKAAEMFEQCLTWIEHQPEASVYNTSLLRELHSLASQKRVNSMKQTSIPDFI